jgi:signal transduction histidine kinase
MVQTPQGPNGAVGDATGSLDDETDDDITVRVGVEGDGFYVADDGIGIDPAEWESVFEKGYTTREDGSGYGLTIVRNIVGAHGWDIDVTESRDGGARFEITGVDIDA